MGRIFVARKIHTRPLPGIDGGLRLHFWTTSTSAFAIGAIHVDYVEDAVGDVAAGGATGEFVIATGRQESVTRVH